MIAALIAVLLLAQTAVIPANVVTWTLQQPRPVRAGEAVSLTLTATIAPGWHLYAMAQPEGGPISTEVSLPATALATFARPIVASKPATIVDPNFDLRVQLYSESATFTLPLRVAATAPAGAHPFAVEARYQSCNDVICLPPKAVRIETTLTIRSR
ncbi:MAG: protein-disulfide reductase DsbD N-terminal domain-containing protein [Vicinamibacterales bacterium]